MVCYTAYILILSNYCLVNKLRFKILILNIKVKKMLAHTKIIHTFCTIYKVIHRLQYYYTI